MIHLFQLPDKKPYMIWIFILKTFGVPLFGFNRDNANGDPISKFFFTVAERNYDIF